jgi:hypothetical protein
LFIIKLVIKQILSIFIKSNAMKTEIKKITSEMSKRMVEIAQKSELLKKIQEEAKMKHLPLIK